MLDEFATIVAGPDEAIDLGRGALLIARARYPDLDIDQQISRLDALARGAERFMEGGEGPLFQANSLSQYLFDEVGFRGNQDDYYDPDNSCLNRVLERRRGIPITLSVVYIEVGSRLGMPLAGVGMPGHFLVRHLEVDDLFIDPFHGGILLSAQECADRMHQVTGGRGRWDPEHLRPTGKRELLARMLRNLKGIYLPQREYGALLPVMDLLVAADPENAAERGDRAMVHYRLGHYREALDDLTVYLDATPDRAQAAALLALRDRLQRLLRAGG